MAEVGSSNLPGPTNSAEDSTKKPLKDSLSGFFVRLYFR